MLAPAVTNGKHFSWLGHISIKQVRFPSRAPQNTPSQVAAIENTGRHFLSLSLPQLCITLFPFNGLFALNSCSDVILMVSPASREMRQAYLLFIRHPVLCGCWHAVAPKKKKKVKQPVIPRMVRIVKVYSEIKLDVQTIYLVNSSTQSNKLNMLSLFFQHMPVSFASMVDWCARFWRYHW